MDTTNAAAAAVIAKIRAGTVTLDDLTAAGAIQLGLVPTDLVNYGCAITGNECTNVFAVSIPGVTPAAYITWFQAAAAARNAGKRLPTNAEWQAAALGTPDDSAFCNTTGGVPMNTGSLSQCVSDVGAFDMVGNFWEWAADWHPRSDPSDPIKGCSGELFTGTGDFNCLSGATHHGGTGAVLRGGTWGSSSSAGVFAIGASQLPSEGRITVGFRAAR